MILAIETSTKICSVALLNKGKILAQKLVDEKNIHSEKLILLIDKIILESKIEFDKISKVAISAGPGSFTGLRIGMSTAKGICYAKNIAMILVPTLDALANEFVRLNNFIKDFDFAVLLNSKRDEAYYAFYSFNNGKIKLISEYDINQRIRIFELMREKNINNFISDEEYNIDNGMIFKQISCNAISVGIIAEEKNIPCDIFSAEPIYVRSFK